MTDVELGEWVSENGDYILNHNGDRYFMFCVKRPGFRVVDNVIDETPILCDEWLVRCNGAPLYALGGSLQYAKYCIARHISRKAKVLLFPKPKS